MHVRGARVNIENAVYGWLAGVLVMVTVTARYEQRPFCCVVLAVALLVGSSEQQQVAEL